jgi:hypothetical protein
MSTIVFVRQDGRACPNDRLRIVVPGGRYGAVVGRKAAHQPQGLQVADLLQMPRGADLIEIPQIYSRSMSPGLITRATCCGGRDATEPEFGRVEAGDVGINNSD